MIVCDVTTGYFFRDVKDDTVTSQVLSTGLFQNEKDKMMSWLRMRCKLFLFKLELNLDPRVDTRACDRQQTKIWSSLFPFPILWGVPFNEEVNWNCHIILRLSLNKTSMVAGWFLVTCFWSNSNVYQPVYNCAVVARADFAIWLFEGKSKYITKHFMYGPSGN